MTIAGKIFLKKGKEISIERKHPWVFSGAIQKTEGALPDGSWVEVADFKGKTLGFGHYQNGSIAVRMLSFGTEYPSGYFWSEKLNKALKLRRAITFHLPRQMLFASFTEKVTVLQG